MRPYTHAAFGLFLSEITLIAQGVSLNPAVYFNFEYFVQNPCHSDWLVKIAITTACFLIGSYFPDIDMKVDPLIAHRTITHSWPVYISFSIPFLLFWYLPGIMFCVGALGHILLDGLTPAGIPKFNPFGSRVRWARIPVGGVAEALVFLGIFLVTVLTGVVYVRWIL